jgi:S1-C subfamily serine protease
VIDGDGYIVTNRHVVDGADDIDVQFSTGKHSKRSSSVRTPRPTSRS